MERLRELERFNLSEIARTLVHYAAVCHGKTILTSS